VHVLFVGLGRMGYAMAGRIAQRIAEPLYVSSSPSTGTSARINQ
jgi:3-hydroxyisobutyrate dehydrogenase-like beta-hydroxyacid dehydrogenase